MRRNLFWLSDQQWKRIEPHLPTDVRGVERADDRRVISGIVQVLKSGCRWCDCPPEYGPPTTIYNRFVRWAKWSCVFWNGNDPVYEDTSYVENVPPNGRAIKNEIQCYGGPFNKVECKSRRNHPCFVSWLLDRSIAWVIRRFASLASPQPANRTHLPPSRSL
jgi:hypothetical protein